VEALLRWQHPQRGLMAPAEFVPLAEETGQIVAIGRWVLGEACREARAWRDRFPFRRLRVSVNVSGVQLRDGRLVEDVRWALEAARLPADDLVLELTETVLMRETDATLEVLRGLRDLGVRLAVDDFGTGYASLTYLQRFPVEVLKIDRAFVSELGSGDEGQGRLARGIVDLARALEIDTVAEGIEDAGQLADLRRLGCRLGQGRFFAEPLSPAEVDVLLSRQRPRGTPQTARTEAEVAVG
jgi:EAL domain-containing protein (putative c-di-GMP-specific phosphodiesterase class I)